MPRAPIGTKTWGCRTGQEISWYIRTIFHPKKSTCIYKYFGPDFQGGADRNPRISGVNFDGKLTFGADLTFRAAQKKWRCICTP